MKKIILNAHLDLNETFNFQIENEGLEPSESFFGKVVRINEKHVEIKQFEGEHPFDEQSEFSIQKYLIARIIFP